MTVPQPKGAVPSILAHTNAMRPIMCSFIFMLILHFRMHLDLVQKVCDQTLHKELLALLSS